MNDTVIKAENLGKLYRIGSADDLSKTFREAITDMVVSPFRRIKNAFRTESTALPSKHDYIWALKDVSFEIKRGEVVGIIGRNGAGKSTLLKILARITEPTEGRVTLKGRVGSLLEVGTGFHSELTGEENIYLSGTILGMSSQEISRKFDEIVSFAEVEKFIHTPIKHYSSGMYMRLAFAVAAHLEPEILLIDEVLAVGDVAFQKKCLGKMGDVANEGRTVLFVSHNMTAVQSLCKTAFQLESGRVLSWGDARSVVGRYLTEADRTKPKVTWPVESAPGDENFSLTSVRVYGESARTAGPFPSSKNIYIEMTFIAKVVHPALCVGFDLVTDQGEVVMRSYQTDSPPNEWPEIKGGKNILSCIIPAGLLNGRAYNICPRVGLHNLNWIVNMDNTIRFEVILDHGNSPFWHALDGRNKPGTIAPVFRWQCLNQH
jgi:lipopolysaccharide transport system ATP-binding protein